MAYQTRMMTNKEKILKMFPEAHIIERGQRVVLMQRHALPQIELCSAKTEAECWNTAWKELKHMASIHFQ